MHTNVVFSADFPFVLWVST